MAMVTKDMRCSFFFPLGLPHDGLYIYTHTQFPCACVQDDVFKTLVLSPATSQLFKTQRFLDLQPCKTEEMNKFSHLRSWNQTLFGIFRDKWLKLLFFLSSKLLQIYLSAVNQSTNGAIISPALIFGVC